MVLVLIWLLGSWVPVFISDLLEENIISDGVLTSLGFRITKFNDIVRVEGANGQNIQELKLRADRRVHFTKSAIKIPQSSFNTTTIHYLVETLNLVYYDILM